MSPGSKKEEAEEEEEEEEEEDDDPFLLGIGDFKRRGINIHDKKLTGYEAMMVIGAVASQKLHEQKELMRMKKKKDPNWVSKQERLTTEKALKKPITEPKKPPISDLEMPIKYLKTRSRPKRPKRVDNGRTNPQQTIPDMPHENMINLIESINGTNIKLVIEKRLLFIDTYKGHDRMWIPEHQIRSGFLRQQEKEWLDKGGCMRFMFVEPSLAVSEMGLKKWSVEKEGFLNAYVLTKGWKNVLMANDLKEDDGVQVWSFRVQEKLCLALVRVSSQASESAGSNY